MPDFLGAEHDGMAEGADRQILFEGAVLALMDQILETGRRIDLAVAEYLKIFPIAPAEFHIRPDLIICVSDCQSLLRHAAGVDNDIRQILADTTRAWRGMKTADRLSTSGGVTRIQACIGNIRRAIASIT
ncbi:conserved protein of unknown function [Magnetospirillum sp. XM-1]|uniref:hypothetical protein n=1 Tax=Magnetospirillum sp. XM-1 TaxID=1663591 RepID=UPI00073DF767|nr:hypothetical protein [Magnetospirillum sp. XM-1]CUW38912.1 conserved protein of unknown function [Magnetospirillum sp. XM-1]